MCLMFTYFLQKQHHSFKKSNIYTVYIFFGISSHRKNIGRCFSPLYCFLLWSSWCCCHGFQRVHGTCWLRREMSTRPFQVRDGTSCLCHFTFMCCEIQKLRLFSSPQVFPQKRKHPGWGGGDAGGTTVALLHQDPLCPPSAHGPLCPLAGPHHRGGQHRDAAVWDRCSEWGTEQWLCCVLFFCCFFFILDEVHCSVRFMQKKQKQKQELRLLQVPAGLLPSVHTSQSCTVLHPLNS